MECELADLGCLHAFPQCPSAKDLPLFLGDWLSLVNEQGQDLPHRHLTTLLKKMLPPEVKDNVKKMGLEFAPYTTIVQHLQKRNSTSGLTSE